MREEGLYVGDRTLTAELARQRRLYEGLRGNAGRRLATILSAVLGRKMPGLPEQHKVVAAHSRAILLHHGFDPDTHTVSRTRGLYPGMLIRDQLGRPQIHLRAPQLKALEQSDAFAIVYGGELQAAGLA